ncbi:MAG TPA: SIS domain-containing protein [Gemmatimonadaceae bacterium]|nr:SIS domain-containing protein [Gemmatimonadaceae bacterium]
MPPTSQSSLADYFAAHQTVAAETVASLSGAIAASSDAMAAALVAGRKVIVFGNGGSSTQASHLVGELLGRFKDNRRPLPAVALACDPAAVTCIANDFGYETLFERQVEAFTQQGDIVVGLTTSGKSENVLRGLAAGKKGGGVTIALTGAAGLAAGSSADHVLAVPSKITAHIQEMHLMLLHLWCVTVDEAVRNS